MVVDSFIESFLYTSLADSVYFLSVVRQSLDACVYVHRKDLTSNYVGIAQVCVSTLPHTYGFVVYVIL